MQHQDKLVSSETFHRDTTPPQETSLEDLPPFDDGTLESRPPRLSDESLEQVAAMPVARRAVLLVGSAVLLGIFAASAQLGWISGPPPQATSEPPWVVLRLQSQSLRDPGDDALRAQALAVGEAYLETAPDSPWRRLIQENHASIMD